ncbi:hypothetical protein MMC21_001114 [Puttea exsequens]|nr:hypothetical protein [Puttea exsequens]
MLQQYPYNVVLDSNGHQSPSVYSTRQSTPKLPRSLRSPASLSQLPRKLSKSKAGKLRSNSPPVTPTFYDYTEDFDDQDNFANVSVSTAILFEQSTPEAASNTYFELDQSPNNSGPPELPSDSSSPKPPSCREDDENDLLPTGLETVGGGWIRAGGQDLSDVLELPEKEGTSDHGDQRTEKQNAISQKNRIRHLRLRQVSAHEAETVADRPGTDEDFKSPAIADLDGKVEASGVHPAAKDGYPSQRPPSLLLKYSQRHGPHIATPNNLEIHDAAALSQRELKTPKPTRDSTAILPSVNKAASVDDIRGSSSEDHSGHGLTEILSPTPERSITSPVARDRFSKILSIDESLISLNNLGSPSKKAERNIDSHQVRVPQSEIGNVVPSSREQLSRDRSIYFRKPVKPSSAAPILVEASDSDDEPELTNALRTTFCNTESQAPNIAAGSSLSTLPSQRASRVSRPPSSLRRTPAKRKSDRHLSTSSVVTLATPSQKEKPQTQSAPKRGEDESSNEVPVFNREESIRVDRSLNAEASATGERSLPELDKELPPLPRKQPSLKAFSPPAHSSPTALPFSFSPLINKRREDLTIAELEAVTSSYLEQEEKKDASDTSQYTPLKSKTVPKRKSAASLLSLALKLNSDRESAASPISSRPWNLDTSYPWDDEAPKLEVNLPESIDSSQVTAGKVPRFKLKIQRASTLTGVSRRRSKQASSVDGFSPSDILPGPAFRRKKHPPPPLFPTNMNSSHDILRPSLQRTRFVERFDQPASPATLMPNSAGPEVRSFFSDDSSLPQPKGSLRKRLSDFRARTVRAVSMDQNRGYDRGLLSSTFGISRASGRSSRQSQHTAGASSHTSQVRHVQWNVVSKIKEWFQKSEDRVRDWRWRIRYRKGRTRAASTPLYAGV